MLDKDKLIIIVEVGISDLNGLYIYERMEEVRKYFFNTFDESVRILILPNRDTYNINLKQLNTEKISVEELNEIIVKAEDIIKKIEVENGK